MNDFESDCLTPAGSGDKENKLKKLYEPPAIVQESEIDTYTMGCRTNPGCTIPLQNRS